MSKTITELPAVAPLSGVELIEFSQKSTTVKKTGVTVSAAAADNSFNDSANGFLTSGFAVGDRVGVTGFTNAANNLLMGVITILTAAKMTIGGTDGDAIVNEAAGNAVTIAKWTSKRATAADLAGLVPAGVPDAPSDGTRYVRLNAAWSTIPLPIGDAPSDGTPYSRKDAAWVAAGSGGVPEAPISMTFYARQNGAWAAIVPFTDAPSDGSEYVRKNGAWSISSGGGGGGTASAFDWTDQNVPVARRYWQLEIPFTDGGGGQPLCIAEIVLRDAAGNVITGTWTANSSAYGAIANINNGDGTATFWGGSVMPGLITFDAGAGVTVIPNKIEMTARSGFPYQAPGTMTLKSSPDNATWTSITTYSRISDWLTGQRRVFLTRPYMVQLVIDQFGTPGSDPGHTTTTVAEVEMLGAGADLTLPATTSDDIAGSIFGTAAAANALNGSLADYWGAAAVNNPMRLEYRFAAAPTTLDSIAITARNGFGGQGPGGFKVLYSRDGITYKTAYQSNYIQAAWGNSNERRVFPLSEVTERTPDVNRRFAAAGGNSPVAAWAKVPIEYPDLITANQIHDTQSAWDGTNTRYIPKKAGFYLVNCRVKTATAGELRVAIAKNGTRHMSVGAEGTSLLAAGGSGLFYCNGSTDYLEVYAYTDTARAYVTTSGGAHMDTYMEVIGPL